MAEGKPPYADIHPMRVSSSSIVHFRKLFVCPSKFCISIVFVFSWDHCNSQVKLETMLMQNLGGQTKSIMVFSSGLLKECLFAIVTPVKEHSDINERFPSHHR